MWFSFFYLVVDCLGDCTILGINTRDLFKLNSSKVVFVAMLELKVGFQKSEDFINRIFIFEYP